MIAQEYSEIFKHSLQKDCVLTSCAIGKNDCKSPFDQPAKIKVDQNKKYQIIASETNPDGYDIEACFSCMIMDPSNKDFTFIRN